MKRFALLICSVVMFAIEIVALAVFAAQAPDGAQDTVAVNEVVRSVATDIDNMNDHVRISGIDYAVLSGGNVIYRTRAGLSETVNAAIAHRDTILDVERNGEVVGKIIIYNDGGQALQSRKRATVIVLSVAIAIECAVIIVYAVYNHITLIKPFHKLERFAERVACGNLDIPLEMDKRNMFGAFTESFDIMRSELKKARLAEAQANASKKELVAKLSHDIKTPVASIKVVAEVGAEIAKTTKDQNNYLQIIGKADQINTLINNLFSATLEDLQQLSITPVTMECAQIKTMLKNADYLHRANIPELPECLIFADALRLQQVFDNIFANSYKYSDTEIFVTAEPTGNGIAIAIEDTGGGVPADELPAIKEKFKRGSNSADIEGAGLGLYISDCFMKEMGGELSVENGSRGLKVTVNVAMSN